MNDHTGEAREETDLAEGMGPNPDYQVELTPHQRAERILNSLPGLQPERYDGDWQEWRTTGPGLGWLVTLWSSGSVFVQRTGPTVQDDPEDAPAEQEFLRHLIHGSKAAPLVVDIRVWETPSGDSYYFFSYRNPERLGEWDQAGALACVTAALEAKGWRTSSTTNLVFPKASAAPQELGKKFQISLCDPETRRWSWA